MKTDDIMLMAYVDGELAPGESQQVEEHIRACAEALSRAGPERPAECLVRGTTSGCAKRRYTYDNKPDSSIFTGRRARKSENLIISESNGSVL
ncbi:MAG: hypothetical protein JWR14_4324 [Caballeronia sp.]|jgi:Putative zinc-finger|uniref:anti-sigma factor family protein n=1 Tax=Caballeronia sp. TaxID=1931223 RepID=UPI002634C332|nr:zf-HC2 domain-containing protein [Caballeronia sp.]MDB5834494.1 hypothetical protein [Caballeronia sp.]